MHDLDWSFPMEKLASRSVLPLEEGDRLLQSLNCVGCPNIKKVVIPPTARCVHLSLLNLSLSSNLKEVDLSCCNLFILNLRYCCLLLYYHTVYITSCSDTHDITWTLSGFLCCPAIATPWKFWSSTVQDWPVYFSRYTFTSRVVKSFSDADYNLIWISSSILFIDAGHFSSFTCFQVLWYWWPSCWSCNKAMLHARDTWCSLLPKGKLKMIWISLTVEFCFLNIFYFLESDLLFWISYSFPFGRYLHRAWEPYAQHARVWNASLAAYLALDTTNLWSIRWELLTSSLCVWWTFPLSIVFVFFSIGIPKWNYGNF